MAYVVRNIYRDIFNQVILYPTKRWHENPREKRGQKRDGGVTATLKILNKISYNDSYYPNKTWSISI